MKISQTDFECTLGKDLKTMTSFAREYFVNFENQKNQSSL